MIPNLLVESEAIIYSFLVNFLCSLLLITTAFYGCTQVAAELRIPVGNRHVYAFAEHGNDLGSSKEVKGNPTEVYGRMGRGSSYGVGVKLGQVRAEYAIDHNTGTGAVFFHFGERF